MMLLVGIFLTIFTFVHSQISPTWIQTPFVQSRTVTIANNQQKTSGTYFQNITYQKPLSSPTVLLSIRKIRIVSYSSQYGYKVMIEQFMADKFEQKLIITSPTVMWHLEIRFFAYQQSVTMFGNYMQVRFFEQTTSVINSGRGTVRTETLQQNINTVNLAHTFQIAAFCTGFLGDSPDFYQANITGALTVNNRVNINVVVAADTQINEIYVYVIIADVTGLAVQSRIFIETGLTQTSYGVQYSYFTPAEGFLDGNYVSGMLSFSQRDNVQFNLTVSGFTFLTSTTSKYDQVRHFNLYSRQCTSPYDYFNKNDRLCYVVCPAGTYIVEAYSVCQPCHYSCATCIDASTCDTCQANRYIPASAYCTCVDYFYQSSYTCIACHYTCQTCSDDQYIHCLTCQASMKRTFLQQTSLNKTCPCNSGYYDVGVSRCDEICGDGLIYEDACDDGNTASNDGCSSVCAIQTYFTCTAAAPSFCYYNTNATITIVKMQKQPYQNFLYLYMKIQPYVPAMATSLSTDNFELNFTHYNTAVYESDNYTVLKVFYTSDLEDIYGRISFVPDLDGTIFSNFNASNTTVKLAATDGQKILSYNSQQYTSSIYLQIASLAISCIILASSLLFCIGQWKQLGNQLFFVVQFAFMSYIAMPYFTPYTVAVSNTKYVMGYNLMLGQQTTPDLAQQKMQFMGYSVAYQYNFNIMLIMPVVALILYGFYRLFLYLHTKKVKDGMTEQIHFQNTILGKIFSFCQFDLFVYWVFISMQQILVSTVVQSQNLNNPAIFVFVAISLLGVLISTIVVIAKPNSMKAYRQKLFHKHYGNKTFLAVLFSTLAMDAFLLIAILVSSYVFYVLLVFPLAIVLYTIIQRPFKSVFNNIRLVIIQLCLLTILILQVITINTQQTVFLSFPIGYLCCIAIAWLVTFITWLILLFQKVCKNPDDDSSELFSLEQSKQQEEEMQNKFKEVSYLMFNKEKDNSVILPQILEMKQLDSNSVNKSRMTTPKTSSRLPHSKIKNQRQLNKIFDKSDPIESKRKEIIANDDQEMTIKKRKNSQSQLKSPIINSSRIKNKSARSNIYEDILASHVSRYK